MCHFFLLNLQSWSNNFSSDKSTNRVICWNFKQLLDLIKRFSFFSNITCPLLITYIRGHRVQHFSLFLLTCWINSVLLIISERLEYFLHFDTADTFFISGSLTPFEHCRRKIWRLLKIEISLNRYGQPLKPKIRHSFLFLQ